MKCILNDIRRALTGKWFFIAVAASTAALYMSIGNDTYSLMSNFMDLDNDYFHFTLANLLFQGLIGEFGAMTLPALSALPFAAQPLQEIKSGAIRPAVFRVGRKEWMLGKGIACLLAGMLLPLAAAFLLAVILHGIMLICDNRLFPAGDLSILLGPLIARMLCGGIWAGVGCIIALLSETAAAAYLAPLCLCYALMMVGTRFFPAFTAMNPMNWVSGWVWPLLMGLIAVGAMLLTTLNREVNRYA